MGRAPGRLTCELLVVAFALAATPSCAPQAGGGVDEASAGWASLPLRSTSSSGNVYALGSATFRITGAGVTTELTTDGPADNGQSLTAMLPAGSYAIELLPGWTLSRVTATEIRRVSALLTSPNPTTFGVLPQQGTAVGFAFAVQGDGVDFGAGSVGVTVSVSDSDGGAPGSDGGGAGDGPGNPPQTFRLTTPIQIPTAGFLSVTSTPAGIACAGVGPGACIASFVEGTMITLAAAPLPGSGLFFSGWVGDCAGTQPTITFAMDRDRVCFPLFDREPPPVFQLVVPVSPSAAGFVSVRSAPAGIDCNGLGETDCAEGYAAGTAVTLTATPAAGSGLAFTGWLGDCAGKQPTTSFTMNRDRVCFATFAPASTQTFQLTTPIELPSVGYVAVTSAPAGISCNGFTDCSQGYTRGTEVTLTATPAPGYFFTGWLGDCAGTLATTTFVMDHDRVCMATISNVPPPEFRLEVSTTPEAGGAVAVTSAPAGIACNGLATATHCSESYPAGTVVTLSAAAFADSGLVFTGWSGDCAGSAPTTTLTLDGDRSCTANFHPPVAQQTFQLAVPVTEVAAGYAFITSSPSGIACNGFVDCIERYPPGTVVTLSAHVAFASGFVFAGWTGDCAGPLPTTTITMDRDRICMATFRS